MVRRKALGLTLVPKLGNPITNPFFGEIFFRILGFSKFDLLIFFEIKRKVSITLHVNKKFNTLF